MKNCQNCGAPIIGLVCEYCGTHHYDLPIETRLLHLNKQSIMARVQLSQAAQTNDLLQKIERMAKKLSMSEARLVELEQEIGGWA